MQRTCGGSIARLGAWDILEDCKNQHKNKIESHPKARLTLHVIFHTSACMYILSCVALVLSYMMDVRVTFAFIFPPPPAHVAYLIGTCSCLLQRNQYDRRLGPLPLRDHLRGEAGRAAPHAPREHQARLCPRVCSPYNSS